MPIDRIHWRAEVFVHPGGAEGEFGEIGFADNRHLPLASGRETFRVAASRGGVLGQILRTGRGHLALHVDEILDREAKSSRVVRRRRVGNESAIARDTRLRSKRQRTTDEANRQQQRQEKNARKKVIFHDACLCSLHAGRRDRAARSRSRILSFHFLSRAPPQRAPFNRLRSLLTQSQCHVTSACVPCRSTGGLAVPRVAIVPAAFLLSLKSQRP